MEHALPDANVPLPPLDEFSFALSGVSSISSPERGIVVCGDQVTQVENNYKFANTDLQYFQSYVVVARGNEGDYTIHNSFIGASLDGKTIIESILLHCTVTLVRRTLP